MSIRSGTDKDAESLYKTFRNLGFDVVVYNNYTCAQMHKVLKEGACLPPPPSVLFLRPREEQGPASQDTGISVWEAFPASGPLPTCLRVGGSLSGNLALSIKR